MDGASDEPVWRTRRVVLAALLVVGVLTTGYGYVATQPGDDGGDRVTATDDALDEVVTAVRPSAGFDGPLRLGRTLVVGRLGAPVVEPENTAASFDAAIDAGVDHVEAEVVMSRDGQLVVRGSNELSRTTDVASRPELADRRTTKTIDGEEVTDWFSEDLTLAELRTLRAVEPDPELRPQSASSDGEHPVIAFDDLVAQVKERSDELGRDIGIFVRPLRPSYFREQGLALEPAIARSLTRSRLVQDPERVTVESPDLTVLRRVEETLGDNVLTAYVVTSGGADALSAGAIADLPDTVDAVLAGVGAFAGTCPFDVADRVHEAGMALGIFPISYENALLTTSFRSDADTEVKDPSGRGDLRGQVVGLLSIDLDVILAESPAEVVEVVRDLEADPPQLLERSC